VGLDLPASSENVEFHLEYEVHWARSEALGRDAVDESEANGIDGMITLGDLELQVALPHFPGRTRQIDLPGQEHRSRVTHA
jgi:hypothetical protein